MSVEDIKSITAQPYRVRGVLPARGLAAIYGASGSGKSFLAMDLAFSLANGRASWFGLALREAPVVYVALEGQGGLQRRVLAWEAHNQLLHPHNVVFKDSNFSLCTDGDASELAREVTDLFPFGCVIFIDTLNQAAPGADENGSSDMGVILSSAQRLSREANALVILIHHSGKDRSKGMRGHSSLFAAMDAVIEVTSSASGRSWCVSKAKDDQTGTSHNFALVAYSVGTDIDGFELRSCAVEPTFNPPTLRAKPLMGKHQKAAFGRLSELFDGPSSSITWDNAVAEVASSLSCGGSRRTTIAKETLERLIENGHFTLSDGALKLQGSIN